MTFDILRVVQVYGKKLNSRFSHSLDSNFIPMVSKMFEFSIFGYIIKFAIKKRVGNRKKVGNRDRRIFGIFIFDGKSDNIVKFYNPSFLEST